MNTANQDRPEVARAGEALNQQYQTLLEGWADVSKCCLEAADNIYQTGVEYVKDQTGHLHEIACDPAAAMREDTYSTMIGCGFDAADRIAQAYLRSLETVREPMMRLVSMQLPIGRTMMAAMEREAEQNVDAMQKGAERMEKSMRGATERGAEATHHATHHAEKARHPHGRRKSA